MDKIQSTVPGFLTKLWTLVDDETTDDTIRWDESGKSFHILDGGKLAKGLLPHFFKHSNLASFIRQLNMYGFHKVLSGAVERSAYSDNMQFAHNCFQRGRPELLERIKRKVTYGRAGVLDPVEFAHSPMPSQNNGRYPPNVQIQLNGRVLSSSLAASLRMKNNNTSPAACVASGGGNGCGGGGGSSSSSTSASNSCNSMQLASPITERVYTELQPVNRFMTPNLNPNPSTSASCWYQVRSRNRRGELVEYNGPASMNILDLFDQSGNEQQFGQISPMNNPMLVGMPISSESQRSPSIARSPVNKYRMHEQVDDLKPPFVVKTFQPTVTPTTPTSMPMSTSPMQVPLIMAVGAQPTDRLSKHG